MFIDLFNLASFLIPREFLPKLTTEMKMRLSVANVEPLKHDKTQELETHRISGKTNENKKDNTTEGGLMSKDDFHPVTD